MELQNEFKKSLRYVKRFLELEGLNVWGTQILKDKQGKFHAFFAYWPTTDPRCAWVITCKIGHAISDSIEGEWKVIGDPIETGKLGSWDEFAHHNPNVKEIDGKYVMTYMGAGGSKSNGKTQKEICRDLKTVEKHEHSDYYGEEYSEKLTQEFIDKSWKEYVNIVGTKRVGMAITDDLNGEWTKLSVNEPTIEVGLDGEWDDFVTSNPSLIKMYDNTYAIYYKGWSKETLSHGGNRKYGIATSKNLIGPYVKSKLNPLLDYSAQNAQLEDATAFKYNNAYYIIARDMGIKNSYRGIIMKSKDGYHWNEPVDAYGKVSEYVKEKPIGIWPREGNYERPSVYMENGVPKYLIASGTGGKNIASSPALWRIALPKK